jgi:hypothetical protein
LRYIFRTIGRIEQRTWGTQSAPVQGPRDANHRMPTIRGWRAPDAKPRATTMSAVAHQLFQKGDPVMQKGSAASLPTTITARTIKITIPLSPEDVLALSAVDGQLRVRFIVAYEDVKLRADIAAKSLRKAQATIREAGADNSFVAVQGKLGRGGEILECGLVAQVKALPQKTAPADNASVVTPTPQV